MELTLKSLKAKYVRLSIKRNLSGDKALEAVKQNGYALRYVEDTFFTEE